MSGRKQMVLRAMRIGAAAAVALGAMVIPAFGPVTPVSAEVIPFDLIPAPAGSTAFGARVEIDGNTAVISRSAGGAGTIDVYNFGNGFWLLDQTISSSASLGVLPGINHLAIDGNTVVASTASGVHVWIRPDEFSDFAGGFESPSGAGGAVAVDDQALFVVQPGTPLLLRFSRAGAVFTPATGMNLTSSQLPSTRLALNDGNGRTLAVGIPTATGGGAVRVYRNLAGGTLPTTPEFTYPNPIPASGNYGSDVDVDADGSVAIGHFGAGVGGSGEGAAYVYRRVGTSLVALPEITPSVQRVLGLFGWSVDLRDGRLLVGEPGHSTPMLVGQAWVFDYDSATDSYVQIEQFVPVGGQARDFAGQHASLGPRLGPDQIGSAILVGAPNLDGGNGGVFQALVAEPVAANKLIPAVSGSDAHFGENMSMSGAFAAVGKPETFADGAREGVVEILERAGDGSWSSIQQIDPPGFLTVDRFGFDVALDGNFLAVLSDSEITIYERADSGAPFALAETFSTPGLTPGGRAFTSIDLDGSRLAGVAPAGTTVDGSRLRIFDRIAPTDWALDPISITLPGTSAQGIDVSISGDVIAAGMPSESDGGPNPTSFSNFIGAVHIFTNDGSGWSTTPTSTLRNPDVDITDDRQFGFSVAVDGTRLLVGHRGEATFGNLTGAAWFYEQTATLGVYEAPQQVQASNAQGFQKFGSAVDLDGPVAVVGSSENSSPGSAHIITLRNDTWQETQLVQASDVGFGDDLFGQAVAVSGTSVLVGARDWNAQGDRAGAVYWFTSTAPTGVDAPTLTVDVSGPVTPVTAGATGISVANLPAASIEGYGGADSNVASTPLDAVDGAASVADPSELLTGTSVADLGLDGLDGLGGQLIQSILLSDVVIEGGWDAALAGSIYAGLPLQNVTLGDVLDAGLIDGRSLDALDLSSTPIGSIPIASIALASTPIGSIPLPGGQTWCDLLAAINTSYNCATVPAADPGTDSLVDLAIQGTPIGSIPIGSIPIGSIPIGSIPIGSIPIGSIDIAGSPIGSIPIGSIDVGSTPIGSIPIGSIPIGSIPIGSIDVGSTPIGSIPIGSITIGDIALGDLIDGASVAASPIGSIPIGSIDLAAAPIGSIPIGSIPIGSIPIGSIPIGSIKIDGVPIGSIPIGSIDIGPSPIGSIPIGSIDLAAAPIGSIPIGSIPIGSIPIGSIPIGSIPIGSIPIGSIDIADSPIGSIPIGSIPIATRASVVDCRRINCAGQFTISDAAAAGALEPTATLAALVGADTGVRLGDLIGVDGLSRADIVAQIATIVAGPGFDTLADLLTVDDLTLRDLPTTRPEFGQTDIADLAAALDQVSLGDLLAGIGADEAVLRAELTRRGIAELSDLTDTAGMVLRDLPTDRSEFAAQVIADLLPAMSTVRLGDLLALHPTLDAGDINWGGATLADLSGWQDVTLEDLGAYDATTLAELLDAITGPNDLTFADVLLSLVGTKGHDWSDVELGAIELDNASGPQRYTSGFEVAGGLGLDRAVSIRSTLPNDGVYAPGSFVIRAGDGGALPTGSAEPTVEGNQLVWTLSGVRTGVRYEIDIDVVPALTLGTSTIGTTGSILGLGVESSGFSIVGIEQAFEPNDLPTDSGVVDVVSGTIYASHIADGDDVDLFAVDLPAGARLSVSLSDLPADYDLVVYGPPVAALAPPLRRLEPVEQPLITLDPAVNDDGGEVLQDVPLLDLPVVTVSSSRGTANEVITVGSVRTAGTYFIQVSGYSGANSASPYALYVASDAPPIPLVCVAQNYQSVADRGSLPTTAALAGVDTLILVNRERMVGKYGAEASTALDAIDDLVEYTNVTNTALGTTAAVINVDGDDDVHNAFGGYDAESCDPAAANSVVAQINELVDTLSAADPATNIEQILIVGDDDVIPMARIADDTTIANERTYANTFLDSSANSLFGALSTGHFLSDDPYGDADPILSGDRVLYVTDVGLGRLVETPAEIAGQVATFIGFEGQLDPSTALVTGYDFLSDGAESVADALDVLPDTDPVDEIISETWTATDVIDGLFPAAGESPNIASINAHFDHYRALPADQNASGVEEDLFTTFDVDTAARNGRLAGRSLFSMGCHGGLSVPDELFPGETDGIALDWAQAYARQGAVWVGNTGFGYGETEGIELSERLMAIYASRLDGSVNAGEALFYAKQEYLGTQQAAYGAFDEKVLQQTTFYGIPFYEIAVATPPPAAPIPPRQATNPLPGSDLLVGTFDASPAFTAVTNGEGTTYVASLSGLPGLPSGVVGEQSTPFSPIQPTVSFDVSDVNPAGDSPATVAQGAVITGLVTTDIAGVDPDLARPIVDDSEVETEPRIGNIATDPALFVSSYATPEGPRQSLTALLGTFRSTAPDGSGIQRVFDQLEVETYFRDPADNADQLPPTFREVRSTTTTISGNDVLIIDAVVVDEIVDNVLRVFALVAVDPGAGTPWTSVELTRINGNRWSGSTQIGSGDVEFLVQAVDGNGNTALSTNKAEGFDTTSNEPVAGGPIAVAYSVPPGSIFSGPVTLTATAGGAPIDVRIDGGQIVAGPATAVVALDPAILGEGAHTVTFTTESGARRVETLVFDNTAPRATIISPVDGAIVSGAAPGRVRFSCSDAASGIASCSATLDGSPVQTGAVLSSAAGARTLVVTAIDTAGITTVASSQFTVTDAVGPVVVVPSAVDVDLGVGPTVVVSFTVSATDLGPDGVVTVVPTCLPSSGSAFSIGATVVTCTATDVAGNSTSASFDVTVTDRTAPILVSPGDQSFVVAFNAGGVVDFDEPSVSDNSGAALVVSCAPVSGSTFVPGTTGVTCSAQDSSGNVGTSLFDVTVSVADDLTPPVVVVPADIEVSADAGAAFATVTFATSATDLGPDGVVPVVTSCLPASGSEFTIGVSTVTCTAVDGAGNSTSESFDVTVTDDEAPVLLSPGDQSFVVASNAGGVVDFVEPSVADNSGAALAVSCVPMSGSTLAPGTTGVTCTAQDSAGNVGSVSFDVVVSVADDVTPPVVVVPADIEVSTDAGAAFATVTFTASATDDGPAGTVDVDTTCDPSSGSAFAIGVSTVTCTAVDGVGNSASESFDVAVTDDEVPVLLSPGDQSFVVATTAGGVVDFVEPSVSDNSGEALAVSCTPASGSAFIVGATDVTCTAADSVGNIGSVSFMVLVSTAPDTTPPVVVVPVDIEVSTDAGAAFATVTFTASATDDGPAGTVDVEATCDPSSGSEFAIGASTVTCTAVDGAGNSTSESFDVMVTDDEVPVLLSPGDQSFVVATTAGGVVDFVEPSVSDNSGEALAVSCVPASGSIFVVGATVVTCTAQDSAGNVGSVSFDVVVSVADDVTPPVVVVPADIEVSTDTGAAFATVTFTASATDDGPAGTVDVDAACVPLSGSQLAIGESTVTCTAVDVAGNSTSESFGVTVTDDEAPVLLSPGDQSFVVASNAGGVVDFVEPSVSDNSGEVPVVSCVPASGSIFVVGSTVVTCTAQDGAGNVGSVAFAVEVSSGVDTMPPVVVVPADIEVPTDAGAAFATVTFTASATDDGPAGTVDVDTTCVPGSGSEFEIGASTVICTAVDDAGNSTSESFTVTVTDDEAPVLVSPGDQAFAVRSARGGKVSYTEPEVTDNSGEELAVECSPRSGSRFRIGSTSVSCTAQDSVGNEGAVSFEVIVSRCLRGRRWWSPCQPPQPPQPCQSGGIPWPPWAPTHCFWLPNFWVW